MDGGSKSIFALHLDIFGAYRTFSSICTHFSFAFIFSVAPINIVFRSAHFFSRCIRMREDLAAYAEPKKRQDNGHKK